MAYKVGHVMRQRRRPGHCTNSQRDTRDGNLARKIARGSGRVGGGNEGTDNGHAVEALLWRRARLRQHGGRVAGVDAAYADGGDGAVAGVVHSGEDVTDAGGAYYGFCIFFPVYGNCDQYVATCLRGFRSEAGKRTSGWQRRCRDRDSRRLLRRL